MLLQLSQFLFLPKGVFSPLPFPTLAYLLSCMELSLRYSPGWGNPLHCFAALHVGEGLKRGQCHCLVSGGLHSTHFVSSHFSHFRYGTGVLPVLSLVVYHRVGGFVYVLSLCRPFKLTHLRNQQSLLLPHPPLVFTARSYGALSSWLWNPGQYSMAWGWDRLLPRCPS